MVRTQIYLPPSDHRLLRKRARESGISLTELMRRIVVEHLQGRASVRVFSKEDVLSFVSLGASGRREGSEQHDRALDEAFRIHGAG